MRGSSNVDVKASKSSFRHYGALQGLDKQQTVDAYGIDQVNLWRRSYDIPPPECGIDSPHYPGNDPRYAKIPEAQAIRSESLKANACSTAFTFKLSFS